MPITIFKFQIPREKGEEGREKKKQCCVSQKTENAKSRFFTPPLLLTNRQKEIK
jgi:hypothetical protein